jgi:hypothetical protein
VLGGVAAGIAALRNRALARNEARFAPRPPSSDSGLG